MKKASNQYKIRLKSGQTLGPLDLPAIEELAKQNKINGSEQACKLPEMKWRPIGSFPELADTILLALANTTKQQSKTEPTSNSENSSQETKATTQLDPKLTKTNIAPQTQATFSKPEQPQEPLLNIIKNSSEEGEENNNPYADVPTLLNIKRVQNPDLERTKITTISTSHRETLQGYVDEATKVISTNKAMSIQAEKGEKIPLAKSLGITIRRSILSKNVIYLLVAGLMITFYMIQQEQAPKEAINELRPKVFRFNPVQVNVPVQSRDKKISVELSLNYLDQATKYYSSDSPTGYIKAANLLYKSVFHNPDNLVAKSMLISSYVRLSEIIPRNERYYNTISTLLKVDHSKKSERKPPEFYLALSEFELLIERPDKALQTVEAIVKNSPLPMLLYQQALLYSLQGERNKAISILTRALKMMDSEDRNPRHIILYAQLLDQKDQRTTAMKVLKSYLSKNPTHGLALFTYAQLLYKSNDYTKAIKSLLLIINNPHRVDPATLANTFILSAKIFEARARFDKALQFALAAKASLPDNQEIEDLIFRIRAKTPRTQKLYALLLQAKEKEKAKEYTDAINLYIRARELDRGSPIPLYHMGKLYEKIGKPQMSIELYKKITQLPTKLVDVYFSLANLYLKQYEIENAIAMIHVAKSALPKSSRITHMLGRIALARGDLDQARAQFTAAIEAGSKIPQLYVDMGNLESDRKEIELAEYYYSVALRYAPFNEDALLGIAMSRFYKTTPGDAIKFLEAKLYSRPNSPQILTNLALIHLKSGNKEYGKQYLQQAVRSDTTYAKAYRLMGNLVKEEGDRHSDFNEKRKSYKFALASYGAYSKLMPNEPDGYMAAAELYFFVRDLGAAAKNYHKVVNLAPNYPNARLQLAKIARNGQDPDTALSFIQEEIKRHSNSSDAYVELGKIHLTKKEYALASQALTTAAKLNPKNTEAIIHLGYVHYLQGDYQKSVALFERALEIEPLRDDIHWKIGLAYEKDGKKMKALSAFRNFQGLTTDPEKLDKVRGKIARIQSGQQ